MADEIWPKDSPKADPSKLIEFAERLTGDLKKSDLKNQKDVTSADEQLTALKQQAQGTANGDYSGLADWPEDSIEGFLADIITERMPEFPRAYAWPAIITMASAYMDMQPEKPIRSNLYTVLVGPVHSGKTQACERAAETFGLAAPELVKTYSGSMEQMARELGDPGGEPRVVYCDEISHLLAKSQIDRASFAPILADMFYNSSVQIRLGRKVSDKVTLRTRLSLIGGIVEERFHDSFTHHTAGGLYDRCIFGVCPANFNYDFRPYEGEPLTLKPMLTRIDPTVWEAKNEFLKQNRDINSRLVEIGMRILLISFSYSGYKIMKGKDLKFAFSFARAQHALRRVLAPETGLTMDARCGNVLLRYMDRLDGKYLKKRELLHNTMVVQTYGAPMVDRVYSALLWQGDLAETKIGKCRMVRKVREDEDFEGED